MYDITAIGELLIDFTFNSYLKLAYGEAATDLDRNIVIAAYNYGAAASAYVGA